jgi:hypothetical protein
MLGCHTRRDHLRLAEEALAERRVRRLRPGQDAEGDRAVERGLDGAVQRAHLALVQDGVDAVARRRGRQVRARRLGRRPRGLGRGRRRAVAQDPLQRVHQLSGVVAPAGVAELDRLAAGEGLEVAGEGVHRRHARPVHQDRDHPDPAGQRRGDLQADEVARAVQAPAALGVRRRQPLVADHRQQHVAGADRPLDALHEVAAGLDGVHVHEDPLGAEPGGQVLAQPARVPRAVLAAVGDEDAGHGVPPGAHDIPP